MTESVTGGHFCRRASNFGDSVVPSAAARKHQAIRAALVYEFVVKARKLREADGGTLPNRDRPVGCRSGPGGSGDWVVWMEGDTERVPKRRRV